MATTTESQKENKATEDVYFNIEKHGYAYIREAVGDHRYWEDSA